MTVRKYSSIAQQTSLSASLSSSATTMTVGSSLALLNGVTLAAGETFIAVIDPDTALEEIVEVIYPSSTSSNILTINRGIDGSAAISHTPGAAVRHMGIGRDFREANQHAENTTSAHGLVIANVVETTDTGTVSTAMIADSAVTSAKIADGAIVDADINAAAAIAKTKVAGTAITAADTGTVTSTMIADGTIVNADINAAAAIAYSKLNLAGSITSNDIVNGTIVDADINAAAAIAKTKISGTAITAADTGTVTSAMIADGTIVNADINASAQVAYGKLNLTNSITNADINAAAAIDWTKIAPSATVSATELGYVDGVTSPIQAQIDSKLATTTAASTYAPLASPALTGTPTAPTAVAGTNTTQVATTAFVKTAVDNVVAAAPGALDTLNELASALGNDANFSTTVTNSLATKLPLAGGTMSGAIAMGTNKITGLGNPTLAQDAATKNYVDTTVIAPSNLTGPITSVGNATAIASQTGTGTKFVVDQSPTIVTPTLSGNTTAGTINNTTIPSSKTLVATDSTAYVVPSQTGNAGKYLKTDGTTSSWQTVDALPTQTGNGGKYLTTDGTSPSWVTVSGSLAQPNEPASPADGQVWLDTDGTAPTTVVTRWSKQPAGGTTSLSGNDDNSLPLAYGAGYEQVFLNGTLLSRGNDYTATNGTTITLTNPTVSGDIVEVISPLQIATTDTYTQTAANSTFPLNTSSFYAGKNKVINGDFSIWQRGTSFNSSGAYSADRWRPDWNGSPTLTISQQAFTAGTAPVAGYESQYFYRLNVTSAGSGATYLLFAQQRIEDVRTLAGQTATLSFWAKTDSSRTVSLGIRQNYGSGGSAETYPSLSTGAFLIGTSWTRVTTQITFGSMSGKTIGTNSFIGVDFYAAPNTVQTIDIWGVQLEAGSVATAFVPAGGGSAQAELALCQRYYWRSSNAGQYARVANGIGYSTTIGGMVVPLPVTMRVVPTAVDFSGLQMTDTVNFNAITNVVINGTNSSTNQVAIDTTVASGLTQYRPYYATQTSSSGYLGLSAEL